MANAKRCDICGKYFMLPTTKKDSMLYRTVAGKVELYNMAYDLHHAKEHEGTHFEACDECVQEIMDLVLAKKAVWDDGKEN